MLDLLFSDCCHFLFVFNLPFLYHLFLVVCVVRVSGAEPGMVSPWLETPRRESPRKSTRTRTPLSTPPPLQQHCGQFKAFKVTRKQKLTGIMGELCGKMCLGVSTLFRIQKVPTHFFGAFLAHMAVRPGAHCYQTDAIYTAMQNNAANIHWSTKYNIKQHPIITFTGCKRKV